MVRSEFTFPSADGKTAIHAVEWLPEGAIRAVLQISHGVAEYILRYEPLAAYLTARGFAVVGHDHLGHGASVAEGAPRLYFGPPGSWDLVVEDLYTCRRHCARRFPGVPLFLLGHSMGSFLVRTYLIRHPGTVDGAILMGTGHMRPGFLAVGKAFAAHEIRRLGAERPSSAVAWLSFGAYNRTFAPNRTAFDWISANAANVDAYVADPLCGGNPTMGLFREMLRGLSFISRFEHLKRMDPATPVIFLSGSMDPVGEFGRGVRRAFRAFQKAGVRDAAMKLYPGLRHEILNEADRERIFGDLFQWMVQRIPGAAPTSEAPPHPASPAKSAASTRYPQ